MSKTAFRSAIALASLSVIMLAYSCSFGLESLSSSRGAAIVSISIPAQFSGETNGRGRAVAPDASYLYIRALGGPDGTDAKGYFGPYAAKPGSTFKTKDIKPGAYDGFLLLVTASQADTVACAANGATTTFGAVLSLPDEALRSAIAADSSSGLTIFDACLGNTASYAVLGATTIKEGKDNSIAATLKPATSATMAATEAGTLKADGSGTYRSFVRITGLKARANSSGIVKGKITNPGDAAASLASFAAYRADGSLIPDSVVSSTVIAGGKSVGVTIAAGGDDSCFVYLGFVAPSLTLEFAVPTAPVTDLSLASLAVSNGTLKPAFSSDVTDYALFVTYSTTSVTITPTAKDAAASITVNDAPCGSDKPSEPIALDVGENNVRITVRGTDGSDKTYGITIKRAVETSNLILNFTYGVDGPSSYANIYVAWIEDLSGNVIQNIYVCNRLIEGSLSDTALPFWMMNRYDADQVNIDGVTGATYAKQNFSVTRALKDPTLTAFKVCFETDRSYDPNDWFSSDQPALLYSAIVDLTDPQPVYTLELEAWTVNTGTISSFGDWLGTLFVGSAQTELRFITNKKDPESVALHPVFGAADPDNSATCFVGGITLSLE